VPTRELARQIYDVVKLIGKFTDVDVCLVVPDNEPKAKVTSHIVIGTPGKLVDCLKRERLSLKKLRVLVFDEAELMVDKQGFGDQTKLIKGKCPSSVQVLLFSATYRDDVRDLARELLPSGHHNILLKREELTLDRIAQYWIDCKNKEHKFDVLSDIYAYISVGQSIIFCHTRETAKKLNADMQRAGHKTSLIHGSDMDTKERDRVIDDFREGKTKVLISTNVLARGIDVLQTSLVINYDLPLNRDNSVDFSTYLHRIGRTARWDHTGIAVNFVFDDVSKRQLRAIQEHFGRAIKELREDAIPSLDGLLRDLKLT